MNSFRDGRLLLYSLGFASFHSHSTAVNSVMLARLHQRTECNINVLYFNICCNANNFLKLIPPPHWNVRFFLNNCLNILLIGKIEKWTVQSRTSRRDMFRVRLDDDERGFINRFAFFSPFHEILPTPPLHHDILDVHT